MCGQVSSMSKNYLHKRLDRLNTSLGMVSKTDVIQAEAIVRELDGLPLAIDQAGAYIEETNCGLPGYFDLFRTHRRELLQRRGNFPIDHPQPITTTWALSFQCIEQSNPAAAELLRLCAFLDPERIYEEIVVEGASALGSILGPVAADPFKLNEAIEELLKFSLIHRDHDEKVLTIHRLVQAVLKDSMTQEVRKQWETQAVQAFDHAFPSIYEKRSELIAISVLIRIYYNPILEYIMRHLRISNLRTVGKLMQELFILFYQRLQNLSIEYFKSSKVSSYIFGIAEELAKKHGGWTDRERQLSRWIDLGLVIDKDFWGEFVFGKGTLHGAMIGTSIGIYRGRRLDRMRDVDEE
jgi:hypothetical protein